MALGVTRGLAAGYLRRARALRSRWPRVGTLLRDGSISYRVFCAVAYRIDPITDPDVLRAVDREIAAKLLAVPSLTRLGLHRCVDRIVARCDSDAVRRDREAQEDRELSIWDSGNGLAQVFGRLPSLDAHVVDVRLDALADTVCPDGPRTRKQRRGAPMRRRCWPSVGIG